MKQLVVLLIIILIIFFPLLSQKQQEKETKLVEKMTIVNIEVPVRVYFKNNPVDNLKKEDFKLYENGKQQQLNGFYILRKKIKYAMASEKSKEKIPGRYFVLAFRITHFNDKLKEAVSYVFENILQTNDQVLLFVNDKTFFIKNIGKKIFVLNNVFKLLRGEALVARNRVLTYYEKIHDKILQAKLGQAGMGTTDNPDDDIIHFLNQYMTIWKEYKYRYLMPDVDNYYNFAKYLKDIKKEKWVFNFYQFEMFPKLKRSGPLMTGIINRVSMLQASNRSEDQAYYRIISKLLNRLELALSANFEFPSEEVSKIFYQVNTTFHSFFIPTTKSSVYEDLEYKRISNDIENVLRDITERTGGSLMFSGDVKSSLKKIEEKEDILYMLTYSPDNEDKAGKVRVEVNDSRFRVEFDNKVRADYIEDYFKNKEKNVLKIRLTNIKFNNRKLFLNISNIKRDEQARGRVIIRVRCFAALKDEPVYDNNKVLQIKKNKQEVSLNINFNWLKKGEYTFLIDVKDILSQSSTSEILNASLEK